MAEYNRRSNKFLLRGMNVTLPGDRLGMEWAQVLRNLRCYILGEWRQRPGLRAIADLDATLTGEVFWGSAINDNNAGTYIRLWGTADGKVYSDLALNHNIYNLQDSGYSSDPYSSAIAKPDQSPNAFLFLGNDARQGKFSNAGARTEWGLTAPTSPPTCELTNPSYRVIDECDSTSGFSATTGVASLQTRIAANTIVYILYDNAPANTAWASISPTTINESWQPGCRVQFSGGNTEIVTIQSVQQQISSTTIAAIDYDSGVSGACVIQLSVPTAGLERNSLVRINSAETVRVLSVTRDLDGIPSFRCVTSGTFSAGQTVAGLPSIRAYTIGTHAAAETLSTSYVRLAVSGAGIATLSKTAALDLSSTTGTGTPRPIQDDDYVHVSFIVSDFSLLSEIQLQFDIDAATNTFTNNYFFKSIRPPDLLAAVQQTAPSLTAQQQELQRKQIDLTRDATLGGTLAKFDPYNRDFGIQANQGPLSTPGTAGANQWTEIKIPVKEFQRVGSDLSRGWRNVAAFRMTVNATAAVNVGIDALWIGGTYGPNTNDLQAPLQGYDYCWVARNTATGSKSNPSPITRFQLFPERDGVFLTIDETYIDPQADVFDYYRRGGSVGDFHYLATVPSFFTEYTDSLPDDVVETQPLMEIDHFKPWPSPQLPSSGTCTVIGTTVLVTSGTVDPRWLRGVEVLINNQGYTLYTYPSSTTRFELNESAGSQVGVQFIFQEPLIDGVPMPSIWGPFSGASGDFLFATGDPLNAGSVVWTNGNDPESASDRNRIELCSPSEEMMAGGIIDGINFAFSRLRSWRILPSFNGGASGSGSDFYPQQTGLGRGICSRWGLAFGDRIYFVDYDGIWATKGDALESLTNEDLAPLFRRDGTSTNDGLYSSVLARIDFSKAAEKWISLTYSKDGLYFTYLGVNAVHYTLYHGFLHGGWVLDSYTSSTPTRFVRETASGLDRVLAGTLNGAVYEQLQEQFSDDGNFINCYMITREELWDDTRLTKQIADNMFDVDPAGVSMVVSLLYDNNTTFTVLDPLTGTGRQQFIRDVNLGIGDLKRSVAAAISWLGNTSTPKLYEWQPAALVKPEYTILRATDWDIAGYEGPKWLQGMRLTADTGGVTKQILVQGDETNGISILSINHSGEVTKEYSWTPYVTHQVRIVGLDNDVAWRFFRVEWIYEPEPPLATTWSIQYTSFDLEAYHHIRDMLLTYRSGNTISMRHYIDEVLVETLVWPFFGTASRVKQYQPLGAHKGKYTRFEFTSDAPFALYLKDIEVRVKAWGREQPYSIQRPFGDVTRTNGGARV